MWSFVDEDHPGLFQDAPSRGAVGGAHRGLALFEAEDGLALDAGGLGKGVEGPAQGGAGHSALERVEAVARDYRGPLTAVVFGTIRTLS